MTQKEALGTLGKTALTVIVPPVAVLGMCVALKTTVLTGIVATTAAGVFAGYQVGKDREKISEALKTIAEQMKEAKEAMATK